MKVKPDLQDDIAEGGKSRRHVLKTALAAIAGLAAGYSVLSPRPATSAQFGGPVNITIPKLNFVQQGGNRQLAPQSKTQVLEAIAPALSAIVAQSGDQLPAEHLDALKQAILSRGQLNLADPGAAAGWSITITVSAMPGNLKNKMKR